MYISINDVNHDYRRRRGDGPRRRQREYIVRAATAQDNTDYKLGTILPVGKQSA